MKYFIIFTFLLLSFEVWAQNEKYGVEVSSALGIPQGLAVGDLAPNFKVIDQKGKKLKLSQLLQQHEAVVLMFYRGSWCPVCNRHMNNLNDSVSMILDKNVAFIAIAPEEEDYQKQQAKEQQIDFSLTSDPKQRICKDYAVLFQVSKDYDTMIKERLQADIALQNGQKVAQLPVPATYIIGKDRKIRYRHFDINYQNRASVQEILDNLEK